MLAQCPPPRRDHRPRRAPRVLSRAVLRDDMGKVRLSLLPSSLADLGFFFSFSVVHEPSPDSQTSKGTVV